MLEKRLSLILALGATLFVLVAGGLYAWDQGFFREHRRVAVLYSEDTLRAYAQTRGTTELIQHVLASTASYSNLNKHQIGHALGTIVYEREDLSGIALCGDLFSYGCLHQVIGIAYDERGPSSIDDILRVCSSDERVSVGDCLHAAGHALVYTSGYDPDSLSLVLDTCDIAQGDTPFDYEDSCYGGAFMEYNMHFMSDNEGAYSTGRSLDESAPFAPCDALESEHRRSTCAFWLLPWYHGQYDRWRFNEASFAHLGDYCDSMPHSDMRTACIYASGREAAVNILPGGVISSLCTAVADNAQEFDMCIFGAVRVLHRLYADKVPPLCDIVSPERREDCFAFAQSTSSKWDAVK